MAVAFHMRRESRQPNRFTTSTYLILIPRFCPDWMPHRIFNHLKRDDVRLIRIAQKELLGYEGTTNETTFTDSTYLVQSSDSERDSNLQGIIVRHRASDLEERDPGTR